MPKESFFFLFKKRTLLEGFFVKKERGSKRFWWGGSWKVVRMDKRPAAHVPCDANGKIHIAYIKAKVYGLTIHAYPQHSSCTKGHFTIVVYLFSNNQLRVSVPRCTPWRKSFVSRSDCIQAIHLLQLPDELLLKLVSGLGASDMYKMAKTCQKMRRIIQDPTLVK